MIITIVVDLHLAAGVPEATVSAPPDVGLHLTTTTIVVTEDGPPRETTDRHPREDMTQNHRMMLEDHRRRLQREVTETPMRGTEIPMLVLEARHEATVTEAAMVVTTIVVTSRMAAHFSLNVSRAHMVWHEILQNPMVAGCRSVT